MSSGNIAWPTKEEIRAMSTERLLNETHKAIDATIRWHGMISSCPGCSGHPKNTGAEKVYLHYREVVDQMVNALAEQAPGTLPECNGDCQYARRLRNMNDNPSVKVASFTQTRAEVKASMPRMTPGPWHVAQNGAQVDVYSKLTGERRTVAVAQNIKTDSDAEAIAYLPDLISNGRMVVASLMRLFKHRAVVEIPEAASLLISKELAELRRILGTVNL